MLVSPITGDFAKHILCYIYRRLQFDGTKWYAKCYHAYFKIRMKCKHIFQCLA